MRHKLSAFFLISVAACAQPWSSFLDSSRAIDWSTVTPGFSIPVYAVNCVTQPSLLTGSGNASANTTSIQNALNSCDAIHNVVNIPAGTWYAAGLTFGSQGHQVLRGAGSNATTLIMTAEASCVGIQHGVCMIDGSPNYDGSFAVLPPSGTQQCSWSAGYAKGTTTITLSSCGGAPPLNQTLILDQANDMSDTGGVFICDANMTGCTTEAGDFDGRVISGVTHSLQQVVYTTGVTSLGGGSYTVTITPGIYSNSIRSGQSPGAWWPGFVQNDGIENMTLDGTAIPDGTLSMFDCYQCWARNMRFLNGGRNDVLVMQSTQNVIRDSYFYGAQGSGSQSYGVEFEISSATLVENNIFQQTTIPVMFGQGTGTVIGYNYAINSNYSGSSFQAPYYGHSGGNQMGLWEGNNFLGVWTDDVHGTTATGTFYRNMLQGWQTGKTDYTFPVAFRAYHRANNVVGNIIGQPGYHNLYESYATSSSGGVNGGSAASLAIYELGWSDNSGIAVCNAPVACDPLSRSTLMRWGNYDTVNAATQWSASEASPGAVTYVNANFTSTYFTSLAHALPASLYYSSKPAWWPSGKAWPAVGPDVTTGNVGVCTGTFAGAQATSSGQCTGGTLTAAWSAHVASIPAEDCYLNNLSGPPDGTGSALAFDAGACYYGGSTLALYWFGRNGQSLSIGATANCSAGSPTCDNGTAVNPSPQALTPGSTATGQTVSINQLPLSPLTTLNEFLCKPSSLTCSTSSLASSLNSGATSMCNEYTALSGRLCGANNYGWNGAAFSAVNKGGQCDYEALLGIPCTHTTNPSAPVGTAITSSYGVTGAKTSYGSTFYAPATYFNQGESDSNANASVYAGELATYQANVSNDLPTQIGQTGLIPLLVWQKASWPSNTSGTIFATPRSSDASTSGACGTYSSAFRAADTHCDGALAVGINYAAFNAYSGGKIFVIGPQYFTPFGPDGKHKTAASYRREGCYEGEMLYQITVLGQAVKPFYPRNISISGSTITAQFWFPFGTAIQFDTTSIAPAADGNMGFEWTDTGGSTTTLVPSSATITASDTVTLTLSGTPTSTGELRYAWTAPNGACPNGCQTTTSTTAFTPSLSPPNITLTATCASLGYFATQPILVYETSNPLVNYVYGVVSSCSGSTLAWTGTSFGAIGSHSDWTVQVGWAYVGPQFGPRGNLADNNPRTCWTGDAMNDYALTFRLGGISAAAPYSSVSLLGTDPNLSTVPGVLGGGPVLTVSHSFGGTSKRGGDVIIH